MAQEFTIKSTDIEDKINQLLPSQGGFQPGVDFSASTMVVPIVDLTETAEGSTLRQDLQKAYSLVNTTTTQSINTTDTITNTTGYYLVTGVSSVARAASESSITISDGVTTKSVFEHQVASIDGVGCLNINLIVKLEAGDTLSQSTNNSNNVITTHARQIADLQGNLINP